MWQHVWRSAALLGLAASSADARGLAALRGTATALSSAGAFLDDASAKETPIQRVVKLLEEMKKQLESEMSQEQEMYDKMVCWCEMNNKEKTQAIADADVSISQLESEVAERSGRKAEFATKIEILKGELAEQKASLKRATTIREKEHAEFNAAENDMVESISMLRNAIVVLGRHHNGTELLQASPALATSLASALRHLSLKHEELMELRDESKLVKTAGEVQPHDQKAEEQHSGATLLSVAVSSATSAEERALWSDLLSQRKSALPVDLAARLLAEEAAKGSPALVQQPANFQSYAPQSGQILGVLKQMQEDFELNLSESQKEELKAQEAYTELKNALEASITASAAKLDDLEGDASSNAKALSDAKEDLTTTRETRSADVKFLSDLRLQCQDLDHDWKTRSAARGQEIKAVADAVAILTEDDARTLFHKKMGTGAASFVQVSSASQEAMLRGRVSSLLLGASESLGGRKSAAGFTRAETAPGDQLAAIAVKAQLDSFTRVKEAIDTMVAELKTQQDEEVKHKSFCTESLQSNEKETYAVNRTLLELNDQIQELSDTIEKLVAGIEEAKKAITSTQVEVKAASEVRAEENKAFQEEVTDQRAVQQLLEKAIARMKQVYKGAGFMQKGEQTRQEPPIKFTPYKQSEGSSPVIGLMEQIVEDAKALENEALSAENKAQADYEEYVRNADATVSALQAGIQAKSKAKAESEADKAGKESEQDNEETHRDMLLNVKADTHAECDFVLKNFDVRQKARRQEIEALGQAKAILSGMKSDGTPAEQ